MKWSKEVKLNKVWTFSELAKHLTDGKLKGIKQIACVFVVLVMIVIQ